MSAVGLSRSWAGSFSYFAPASSSQPALLVPQRATHGLRGKQPSTGESAFPHGELARLDDSFGRPGQKD